MLFRRPQLRYSDTPIPVTPYQAAAQAWDERIGTARVQARNWRLMAFGCLGLALVMSGALVWRASQSIVTPYVVEVDTAGQIRAVGEAATPYRPTDAQIAFHLAHFITNVRSLAIDPVIVRQSWLEAYDYTTDQGAATLNEYARANDPFARIGQTSVVGGGHQRRARERAIVSGALDRAQLRAWRARRHRALDRDSFDRHPAAADRGAAAPQSARHLRQRPLLVQGAWVHYRRQSTMKTSASDLCARYPGERLRNDSQATAGDHARRTDRRAGRCPSRRSRSTVVAVPQPLPLPGQLKPLDASPAARTGDSRSTRARRAGESGGARRAHARGLSQRDPGVALQRGCALSALRQSRPRHRHHAAGRRGAGHASPPATPCAGSSAIRPAPAARRSACTFWSNRCAPISRPISSSPPAGASICSNSRPPSKPGWPRSRGTIRTIA